MRLCPSGVCPSRRHRRAHGRIKMRPYSKPPTPAAKPPPLPSLRASAHTGVAIRLPLPVHRRFPARIKTHFSFRSCAKRETVLRLAALPFPGLFHDGKHGCGADDPPSSATGSGGLSAQREKGANAHRDGTDHDLIPRDYPTFSQIRVQSRNGRSPLFPRGAASLGAALVAGLYQCSAASGSEAFARTAA